MQLISIGCSVEVTPIEIAVATKVPVALLPGQLSTGPEKLPPSISTILPFFFTTWRLTTGLIPVPDGRPENAPM